MSARQQGGIAILFLLALAATWTDVARGQDVAPAPPPAKHENKITPEAQAAIDRYWGLVHGPGEHGVRSASGLLVPQGEPAPFPPKFEFAPPGVIGVLLDPSVIAGLPDAASVKAGLEFPFLLAYGGMEIAGSPEFDAELTVKDGRHVLVVTEYREGVRAEVREIVIDPKGLISAISRDVPVPQASKSRFDFRWEKTGEEYRIARVHVSVKTAAQSFRREVVLRYTKVGDVDLLTAFTERVGETSLGEPTEWRIADLVVNGRKVDPPVLPAPGRK